MAKRHNHNSRKPVTFKWPWELDARLQHYIADRTQEERRDIDRSEVVIQALEEFLSSKGYRPPSPRSSA